MKVALTDIKVVDRHRTNLGDVDSLASSMSEIGQLQPIVLTGELRLIAGGRRLAAARSLGWSQIEANVVEDLVGAADLLRAERDENTCRKAFTLTEEHTLYEALLSLTVADVRTPGRGSAVSSKDRGAIAEIVSGSAGRYKTLEKVGEVKLIAEDATQPERVRQAARAALEEIDETGNVSGARMRVRIVERAEEVKRHLDVSTWTLEEQQLYGELKAGGTVVVSMREIHANLVNWAKANGSFLAVDRSTEWGNPFELPYDGDRSTVIRNYADHYLPNKPSLLSRIGELRGKALGCWCAPEACHADELRRLAAQQ
ncbi:DUF4326 domain-containing protein [Kribbella sp. NBC_01505]|uniref:DUF4326 domain-containing protein n=1 Tax=Kribbella sp. NBC_01505 TaxID=2903580 RepID=UPI003864BC57